MEAKIILLSRPLLINTDSYPDEEIYKTIYGFVVPKKAHTIEDIDDYVAYLAAMHCWSSGDGDFFIKNDQYGKEWIDDKGVLHICDKWIEDIKNRCREKLNLKYDILNLHISKKKLEKKIDEDSMIRDEDFYYELKQYIDDDTPIR